MVNGKEGSFLVQLFSTASRRGYDAALRAIADKADFEQSIDAPSPIHTGGPSCRKSSKARTSAMRTEQNQRSTTYIEMHKPNNKINP